MNTYTKALKRPIQVVSFRLWSVGFCALGLSLNVLAQVPNASQTNQPNTSASRVQMPTQPSIGVPNNTISQQPSVAQGGQDPNPTGNIGGQMVPAQPIDNGNWMRPKETSWEGYAGIVHEPDDGILLISMVHESIDCSVSAVRAAPPSLHPVATVHTKVILTPGQTMRVFKKQPMLNVKVHCVKLPELRPSWITHKNHFNW